METVTIRDAETRTPAEGADGHNLTEALGTTDVAINHYRLDPGTRLSGLHAHGDQEEVFVVVEGIATFETLSGAVEVAAGEAIRFGPGEYQSATNPASAPVELYALGAPRSTEDVRIPLACPACDHEYVRPALSDDGETPLLRCPDCDDESTVECPDCGGADMTAQLAADAETPVSVCRDCGYASESQ